MSCVCSLARICLIPGKPEQGGHFSTSVNCKLLSWQGLAEPSLCDSCRQRGFGQGSPRPGSNWKTPQQVIQQWKNGQEETTCCVRLHTYLNVVCCVTSPVSYSIWADDPHNLLQREVSWLYCLFGWIKTLCKQLIIKIHPWNRCVSFYKLSQVLWKLKSMSEQAVSL